jgi:hypothetical protein
VAAAAKNIPLPAFDAEKGYKKTIHAAELIKATRKAIWNELKYGINMKLTSIPPAIVPIIS